MEFVVTFIATRVATILISHALRAGLFACGRKMASINGALRGELST
jgi:hypothetical protein